MAQTKTTTRRSGATSSGGSRGSSSKKSNSRSSTSTRARKQAPRTSRAKPSTNGSAGSVKETVASGAQEAANSLATAVQKAKVPLIASGAAIAGVAGAAVIAATRPKRHKVLGVTVPKPKRLGVSMPGRNGLKTDARKVTGAITDAAKRADLFGQRVSRVASSVQDVSETANE